MRGNAVTMRKSLLAELSFVLISLSLATAQSTTDTIDCGGNYITDSGIITSPNYPTDNRNTREYVWVITAPNDYSVTQLTFTNFSLPGCCDFVQVNEGRTESGKLIGRFSGNAIPLPISSSGRSLWIKYFVKYNGGPASRFRATWRATTGGTLTDTSTTSGSYAVGLSEIALPKAPTAFSNGCGGNYSTATGVVTSPNYPAYYQNNLLCVWVITVPDNYPGVQLNFCDIDIENGYDYIEIREGISSSGRFLYKMLTSSFSAPISIPSRSLWIKFFSDQSKAGRGFRATWAATSNSTVGCGGNYSAATGVVSSPNYPAYYTNNLLCVWVITVPDNHIGLQLSFSDFHTEPCCDYVEIREGMSSSGRLLVKSGGERLPAPISIPSRSLWIKLFTDEIVTGRGFRATWAATDN